MSSLEYVASGLSHLKIFANAITEDKTVSGLIGEYFSSLNGKNNHNFSLLFNAYTEKQLGKRMHELYKDNVHSIHADSGGLQIITRGLGITPEIKEGVYRTQAKLSHTAMCFDEIPVKLVSDKSDRNNTANRFFDINNLEECARQTGRNIKRQIEIFLDEKSHAKPMIIAQGNNYETYMSWVDYLLQEIPSSYHDYIGGIAIAGAALGAGPLEDIERAAYCVHLPFKMKKPYVHVLGVGSIRRMLSYITFMNNGFYPDDLHLSYDSTTHTSGVSLGLYYHEGNVTFNRVFNETYEFIYNDVNLKYDLASKGIDIQKFFKVMNTNSAYYYDDKRKVVDYEAIKDYYHVTAGFACSSISNFTKKIDDCSKSKQKLINAAYDNGVLKEINSLLPVKTLDDFKKWLKEYGQYTKSARVSSEKPATLDNLFGDI